MRLSDCTQGDLLAVRFESVRCPVSGTEQLVVLCSTPRKSKAKGGSHIFMVELVDPETMCKYPAGAPELGCWFNAFAVTDLEVVEVIERRHMAVDDAETDRHADLLDPMTRRA